MPEIFDLTNALVYYVACVFPERPSYYRFADTISVINYSGIGLALKEATYDPSLTSPTRDVEPSFFFLGDFDNTNNREADLLGTVSETVTETSSLSVSFTEGIKIGAEATVKTKIPFIAEGSISLSTEASFSSTQTSTTQTSTSFGLQAQVTVPPGKHVMVAGEVDNRPYKGTLTAKVLLSGRIFINFTGSYQKSIYQVFSEIKNNPPGDFTRSEKRATYRFTDDDLARFQVDSTTQEVYYNATAAIQARYALRARVVAMSVPSLKGLAEAPAATVLAEVPAVLAEGPAAT